MKKLFVPCAILLFVAANLSAQSDVIARIHFLGAEKISADKNSVAFTNEFVSGEARALENQTLNKLSRLPFEWFQSKIAAGSGNGVEQLRPLLDDFLKSEWIFEMRDTPDGSPEYALAIRLDNSRAQLWQKNLQTLLESWTKISAQKIPGGWQSQKHEAPNLFHFERRGDFVVIDCGENKLQLDNQILDPFLKTRAAVAETNWLTADLNWPQLAQLFPAFAEFDFPKIQMQIVGRAGNFYLNGKFLFAKNLSLALEPWRVPTNSLHQPFVSFTAVRGIANLFNSQSWAQPYKILPPPNQLFIWALPQVPFQTFAAIPVPNAQDALVQADARLQPSVNSLNARNTFITQVSLDVTNGQITFVGFPFIAPYLRAETEPAGQFLFGGLFPNSPKSKPLPPELFSRLAEKNLVYYHWEITAERVPALLNLTQLGLLLTGRQQLEADSAGFKWIMKIGPALGNNVTEVFQTAPNEMTFTRKAPGIFTALELYALANWLEAKNFPDCDLKLPMRKFKPHAKNSVAPAH